MGSPAAEHEPSRRPKEPRLRIRWSAVYYLLAAFDVLTVSASLYLSARLLDIYRGSVAQNQEWAEHLDEYAALQQLAAAVNAPGNDVFESHDVAGESERLARARVAFADQLARLRRHLTELHPAEASTMLARFGAVERAMAEMFAEAQTTFTAFAAGGPGPAGRRMAAMDRRYAAVLSALQQLRGDVRTVQQRLFDEQTAAARKLQRYEVLIAALIVLMVGAAIVYGRKIDNEMGKETVARERYRVELEAADGGTDPRPARVGGGAGPGRVGMAPHLRRHRLAGDDPRPRGPDGAGQRHRPGPHWEGIVHRPPRHRDRRRRALGHGLQGGSGGAQGPIFPVGRGAGPRQRAKLGRLRLPDGAGGGGDGRIIVVAKDTTRLLELRETLRREENMTAMGALVAGRGARGPQPDLRDLLDPRRFRGPLRQRARLEKYFRVLRREVERLGDLMRDLLDYGRPPQMETAAVALRDVVADAIRDCCELGEKAVEVTVVNDVSAALPDGAPRSASAWPRSSTT